VCEGEFEAAGGADRANQALVSLEMWESTGSAYGPDSRYPEADSMNFRLRWQSLTKA
jgi:hypothetical protein